MPVFGCSTSLTRSRPAKSRILCRPRVIQSNNVYVAPDGLMYVTDADGVWNAEGMIDTPPHRTRNIEEDQNGDFSQTHGGLARTHPRRE
jgi:hypothetical protein